MISKEESESHQTLKNNFRYLTAGSEMNIRHPGFIHEQHVRNTNKSAI